VSRFGWTIDVGWRRVLLIVACLAGLLAAGSLVMMWLNLDHLRTSDPLHSPKLLALRDQLHNTPTDAALREQIRDMDYQLRREFFDGRSFAQRGLWLLVPSLVVLVVSLRLLGRVNEAPPVPTDAPPPFTPFAMRWALLLMGMLTFGTFAGIIAVAPSSPAPQSPAVVATTAPVAGTWHGFRGTGAAGIATFTNFPLDFDVASGRHIAWKTPIPLPGYNSAVAADGKVFCTGARRTQRAVFCFDARSGRMLWQHDVNDLSPRDAIPAVWKETGYAAPTAAVDDQRIYAIFANGDLVACDFLGQRVWGKSLGVPENEYGHANSLLAWRNRIFVQYDQGFPDDDLSVVYCFDGATGEKMWQANRKTKASWSSPMLIDTPSGTQLVLLAEPWITAHDPETGREIWRCEGVYGDIASTPIFAGGLLIVVNPGDSLLAIRPDGQGNVTDTHIAWKAHDGLPDIASPVSDGQSLYMATSGGEVTCLSLADGSMIWSEELAGAFESSPTLIGDKLLLISKKGQAYVLKTGDTFEQIGSADFGEGIHSSPAFLDGLMILRGDKHMIAVGGAP
jgi:outer membrane protein assembly factor BamB